MKKVRKFLENTLKVVLVIFITMLIGVIEFFKSRTGIIYLESALVGFLVIYLMISLLKGTSKKGKYSVKSKWLVVSPWLEVIWIGGVTGLDFVLIEQVLTMMMQ